MEKSVSEAPKTKIETVLERRNNKVTYDVVPTHREGISLRVEAGKTLEMSKRSIGRLALIGAAYAKRSFKISAQQRLQKDPNAEIKEIAKTNDGLRGIQSDRDNVKLNVFPQHQINWVRQPLKEAMGMAYPNAVGENLKFNIAIPDGFITKDGRPVSSEMIQSRFMTSLKRLGFSKEDLAKIVNTEIELSVDEEKLNGMVSDGAVRLPEEVAEITDTWIIQPDHLSK